LHGGAQCTAPIRREVLASPRPARCDSLPPMTGRRRRNMPLLRGLPNSDAEDIFRLTDRAIHLRLAVEATASCTRR
jgi:hypothetical protein